MRDFLDELNRQTRVRHARILFAGTPPRIDPMPPGYRADEFCHGTRDGFLPLSEAAKQMGMTEAEVLDLAAQGVLETREAGLYLHVRPALVSILAVRQDRA